MKSQAEVDTERTAWVLSHGKPSHFVLDGNGAGSVFCKEAAFFAAQGGLKEKWGRQWQPVIARTIGDARRKGAAMFSVELSSIFNGEE